MRGREGGREGGAANRDGVGLIDLELGWLVLVEGHASGEEVEEGGEQLKVLPRHVGHLEDGADPTHTHSGRG